jgi:mRNA-degrading endonuclease toxin of MazEF toxin-antitoxin module
MGVVNKFASSVGGAGPTVVLGPVTATPTTGTILITDFGGTARGLAAETTLILQGSTDGFVGSSVNLDQIEIPTVGTLIKTLEGPFIIRPGRSFRVVATQGTAGPFSTTVLGETSTLTNVTDLP